MAEDVDAQDRETMAHLYALLPQAESVAIIVKTGGNKEQQFDGSWLRQVLQEAIPSRGPVEAYTEGASLTTENVPPYGEQPV